MFRREMGVSHNHLECSMPEELGDSAQIYPDHYESTGKSRAVAMPGRPSIPASSSAVGNRRRDHRNAFPLQLEGKTGTVPMKL